MNDITFRQALMSVMLDNKYDRFVKNRRTGKLDTKGLYRINTSVKLFKRREARKNKHYAISLVVDCSSSMQGSKVKVAAEAAEKLSKHLSKMEIPHSILYFSNSTAIAKPFNTKFVEGIAKKIVSACKQDAGEVFYGIWEAVPAEIGEHQDMCRFLEKVPASLFDSTLRKYNTEPGRTVTYHRLFGAGTCDGEALAFARQEILKQEGKKMIIMLCDGDTSPIDYQHESSVLPGERMANLRIDQQVEKTLHKGVEVYAVGIQDDSVKYHYPPRRAASIQDIDQLYPHIIKLIRLNLKRG